MPQMSPMKWLMLYLYFLLIFMICIVVVNFLTLVMKSKFKSLITMKINKFILKW